MASRIQEHIRDIDEHRARLRALFDGLGDGVLLLDDDGRLETFNAPIRDLLGMPLDATGRTVLELTLDADIQDMVDALRESGGVRKVQARLAGRELDISGASYVAPDGRRKIALVFHDVSDLKERERTLKDFVANVSHQLRTPLTGIRASVETMQDAAAHDPEASRRFLGIIGRNAGHMARVITRMLSLARLENEARPRLAPVSLGEAAARALEEAGPLLAQAGIEVRSELGGELVLADAEGLAQVFTGLLENAAQHGGGPVRLFAEADGDEVLVGVEDHGPGVPGGMREKIFERFFRGDPNEVDASGNAGLGLAICRRLVETMGGSIWCERPESGGALFRFNLHRAEPGE